MLSKTLDNHPFVLYRLPTQEFFAETNYREFCNVDKIKSGFSKWRKKSSYYLEPGKYMILFFKDNVTS